MRDGRIINIQEIMFVVLFVFIFYFFVWVKSRDTRYPFGTSFLWETGILWESAIYYILDCFTFVSMENEDHDKRKCPMHLSTGECSQRLLPVKDALDVLSGKWKLQIILSLTFGKKRFKQIQREIPGLTPKMLSKELKELEMNELAVRHVYDSLPVSIEYELTPYGRTLQPLINELHNWGSKHRKRIIAGSRKAMKK
jgi:DNA-binding HxlR family transcriptional regulator